MANQVELANKAIERVGANAISSLSESSREAEVITRFWNSSLEEALVDIKPKWAQPPAQLLTPLDDEDDVWAYVYAWPNECLDPVRILNPASREDEDRIPFEVGLAANGTTRTILTNQEEAKLVFVRRVTNCGLFDPLFADALAWKLAADIVIPLKRDKEAQLSLLRAYTVAKGKASARARNMGYRPPDDSCSILKARQ